MTAPSESPASAPSDSPRDVAYDPAAWPAGPSPRTGELDHAYGPNVHLLSDPYHLSLLARLSAADTVQPAINHLVTALYRDLIGAVIARELPVREAAIPTRMIAHTPLGVYRGAVIDPETPVVCVDLARAGMLPASVCFDALNHVLNPAGVRQDHLVMNRVTDAAGQVVGARIFGEKAGGDAGGRFLLFPDPMGATGSSLLRAIGYYEGQSATPPSDSTAASRPPRRSPPARAPTPRLSAASTTTSTSCQARVASARSSTTSSSESPATPASGAVPMQRPELDTLIDVDTLAARVSALGAEISRDYADRTLVVVGILKGSFIFLADLVRAMTVDHRIDFLGLSSYGHAESSSGVVQITSDLSKPIEGCHVLVVEDIIDTGLTMRYLLDNLATRRPASVRVCTLLHKPVRARTEVPIDYVGFTIDDHFVIGYGLDYHDHMRNVPYIGVKRG